MLIGRALHVSRGERFGRSSRLNQSAEAARPGPRAETASVTRACRALNCRGVPFAWWNLSPHRHQARRGRSHRRPRYPRVPEIVLLVGTLRARSPPPQLWANHPIRRIWMCQSAGFGEKNASKCETRALKLCCNSLRGLYFLNQQLDTRDLAGLCFGRNQFVFDDKQSFVYYSIAF